MMGNSNYDENEIIEIICDYLNDKTYSYAIMLKGEWGSGKTYFIKKILEKELEEKNINKKILYISLYGINNIDEISNEIIFDKISNKDKNKTIAISSNLAMNIAKLLLNKVVPEEVKGSINDSGFKELIEGKILENKILIFDDLERCNIPLDEVFGYINNFVEHQNTKVIIIANEEEIKKGKNNNYEVTKEKLIGQTILYKPELDEILKTLIEDVDIEEDLKPILNDKIEDFIEELNKEKHINLRTFQFFLSKINIFYRKLVDIVNKNEINVDNFFRDMINFMIKRAIIYKKCPRTRNDYSFNFDEEKVYIEIIDKFIQTGILSNDNIKLMIDTYKPNDELYTKVYEKFLQNNRIRMNPK